MKFGIAILLLTFSNLDVYAASCSQAEIERSAGKEAYSYNATYVHGTKVILGRATYVGGPEDQKGYFPVFFLNAACDEYGRATCDMSSVLFADITSCTVTVGTTNPNLLE